MWGRITKAVDNVIKAKAPEQIKRQHKDHIINAILDCTLPKLFPKKKPSQKKLSKKREKQRTRGKI